MSETSQDAVYSSWHIRLRRILVEYFSEDDIRTLCFDLRVDYDDLRGGNKTKKVINLISYLARLGRIEELIDLCREARPNVPWDELRAAASHYPLVVEESPDKAAGVALQPAQRSGLSPKQRDRLLFKALMAVVALLLVGGVVALVVWAWPGPPPAVAPAQTPPVTVEATPATTTQTAVSSRNILLSEDFESGPARQWRNSAPAQSPQVVILPDGNHVLQLKNETPVLYAPTWEWDAANYRFEADVMVADLTSSTSIGLHARVLAPGDSGYCQGYRAEIGPGHAAIHLITTSSCNSEWQYNTLNNDRFELRAGEWHHLRLDVTGNQLRFFVDDDLALAATDPENTYRAGGVGLIVFHSDEAYADNVVITALAPNP